MYTNDEKTLEILRKNEMLCDYLYNWLSHYSASIKRYVVDNLIHYIVQDKTTVAMLEKLYNNDMRANEAFEVEFMNAIDGLNSDEISEYTYSSSCAKSLRETLYMLYLSECEI